MGYERAECFVIGRLSRHNSPRDEEHDELWRDLVGRIKEIVGEDKYREIEVAYGLSPDVDGI